MANILLDKAHKKLIQSATELAKWLLSLDALSADDKKALLAIQDVLSKLPKINDGTLAMFGFSVERGDEQQGLVRGWDVSVEYFAHDPEQQGGLEIFSSYLPIPESTDKDVLAIKKQHEVYFHWPIGDICNLVKESQAEQWIEEISQPEMLMSEGDRLRVEIVYKDFYSEIELPC